MTVIQDALAQVPVELIESIEILVRTDSAGATHEVMDFCREHRLRYSAGYELTDQVRAVILTIPETAWVAALASDGENGQLAEITTSLDLTGWPTGSRVIVRRERAHPGAQLSFTDHDGHRFQAVLTDQPDPTSRSSSAASASARTPRHTSATTRTPGFRTCRSETSSTTACG